MPHPIDIRVGLNLRVARISQGLSQSALAEKLGISFQQVQKYERGSNRVSASRLWEFSEALGLDIRYFFSSGEDKLASEPDMNDLQDKYGKTIRLASKIERIPDRNVRDNLLSLIDFCSN